MEVRYRHYRLPTYRLGTMTRLMGGNELHGTDTIKVTGNANVPTLQALQFTQVSDRDSVSALEVHISIMP